MMSMNLGYIAILSIKVPIIAMLLAELTKMRP